MFFQYVFRKESAVQCLTNVECDLILNIFAHKILTIVPVNYRVGHKTCHFTFVHIYANYCRIFKILSLAHFAHNLR